MNEDVRGALASQLLSMQHAIDAAMALLGMEAEEPTTPPPPGSADPATCPHPPLSRRAAAVMGNPGQYFCLACDSLVGGG